MGMSSGSAPAVFVLLIAYSAGLAIPFLVAALALPRLRPLLDWLRRHHRLVQVIAGVFIIVIGVMIYFNTFARLAGSSRSSLERRAPGVLRLTPGAST